MIPLQAQATSFPERSQKTPSRPESATWALLTTPAGRTLTSVIAMAVVTLTIGLIGLAGVL
jgi:hypothetical protein